MVTLGSFARLEAKAGKEEELAAFLLQGLKMAKQETTTPVWVAVRLSRSTLAIVDAFIDEAGRQSHLSGPIAKALMEQAPHLLEAAPEIEPAEVLGAKLPN